MRVTLRCRLALNTNRQFLADEHRDRIAGVFVVGLVVDALDPDSRVVGITRGLRRYLVAGLRDVFLDHQIQRRICCGTVG